MMASRSTLVAWMKIATNSSILLGDCLTACFSIRAGPRYLGKHMSFRRHRHIPLGTYRTLSSPP